MEEMNTPLVDLSKAKDEDICLFLLLACIFDEDLRKEVLSRLGSPNFGPPVPDSGDH